MPCVSDTLSLTFHCFYAGVILGPAPHAPFHAQPPSHAAICVALRGATTLALSPSPPSPPQLPSRPNSGVISLSLFFFFYHFLSFRPAGMGGAGKSELCRFGMGIAGIGRIAKVYVCRCKMRVGCWLTHPFLTLFICAHSSRSHYLKSHLFNSHTL